MRQPINRESLYSNEHRYLATPKTSSGRGLLFHSHMTSFATLVLDAPLSLSFLFTSSSPALAVLTLEQ